MLRTEPQPPAWARATPELPSHLSSPFLFTWAMTVTVWGRELLASFSQRWGMRCMAEGWLFSVLCSLQTEIASWALWEFFPPFQLPPPSFTPPTWLLEIQVWMGKRQVYSQDVWFTVCLIKTAGLYTHVMTDILFMYFGGRCLKKLTIINLYQ